jgi:hypothetical protein
VFNVSYDPAELSIFMKPKSPVYSSSHFVDDTSVSINATKYMNNKINNKNNMNNNTHQNLY